MTVFLQESRRAVSLSSWVRPSSSKIGKIIGRVLVLTGSLLVLAECHPLFAQAKFTAWSLPTVENGNFRTKDDYGVCNDFEVVRPITVSELGMFDNGGDGMQGSAVVRIQLYEDSGKESLLLETVTFDAASYGELRDGFRYKPLARPVTLFPGRYTLTANGFDLTDTAYDVTKVSNATLVARVTLSDGGGLIRFLGSNRYFERGGHLSRSKLDRMIGPPDRIAAGTFVFSPASLSSGRYANDYAALTAGVTGFPTVTDKTVVAAYSYHYGSVAVLTEAAFPVLVEPGGSRLILSAAANYNGIPDAARCVAFAHQQWGHAFGDGRALLFENSVKWASRKDKPTEIRIGLSSNIDASYFASRGYQVQTIDENDPSCACDVMAVDFNGDVSDQFMARLSEHIARGGGLVCTFLPWLVVHGGVQPIFNKVNALLEPFGMVYRSSLSQPKDFGFTNVAVVAYPVYFNAFPAAKLLYEDRERKIQLDSLARAICLNTVAYSADSRPELLAALTSLYSTGSTNAMSEPQSVDMGPLADVVVINGSQANANSLGYWATSGDSLVAKDGRGSVDFQFNVPAGDVYRLKIEGAEASGISSTNDFALILSVDAVNLGRHILSTSRAMPGNVECWTPYLQAGPHTLRIFWDGASPYASLRLDTIHVQTAAGLDTNGNGIKDWVESWVNSQSGLDETNLDCTSYVSPLCIEGRDPYLPLMNIAVAGADAGSVPNVKPLSSPNGRWYADIPLAKSGDTTIHVTYQNGVKSETLVVHRKLINVLDGGSFKIRRGDSLAMTAKPVGWLEDVGQMQFILGTNQSTAKSQTSFRFDDAGTFIVTGMYTSPAGETQSGVITVNVIDQRFVNSPDCWVGKQRTCDVQCVATQIVLESDTRLFCEQSVVLTNGVRLSLLTDEAMPRCLVSRLGDHGPVLDSIVAKGFRVFAAPDTYNTEIETYLDGSRLVETMVILSPVLPDITVQLRVLAGGVMLDDGTILRELKAKDFDALGRYKVRFIMPPTSKTSNCHSIKVIQGTADYVGSY